MPIVEIYEGMYDDIVFQLSFSQKIIAVETLRLFYLRMDSAAHWNHGFEVHIITKGNALYSISGVNDFNLQVGEILVIPPRFMHSEIVSRDCEGICLGFQILPGKGSSNNQNREIQNEEETVMSIFESYSNQYFFSNNCGRLISRFSELADELDSKRPGCLLCAQNVIANVIIELSRLMGAPAAPVMLPHKQPEDNLFFIVSEYFSQLSRNNKNDHTLKELSDLMFMSERQVSRFLLKHYNKTFIQILNDTKINYIKFLLSSTDLSVEAIAERCNWTPKYLYRCFHAHTKTTPANFRKHANSTLK